MCILFVYRNIYANANNYRLIIASNRDENVNRPAVPARFWEKYPHCLGGMDMEPGREGGSWLSLSTKGHAGVLLNLPGETRSTESAGQNRGFLVKDYVTSEMSPESYLNELHLKNQKNQYDPYNLILMNLRTAAVYYLNSSENSTGHVVCQDNVIGFGNSLLDTPLKKVEAGKKWFQKIVENATVSNEESLIEELIKLLGNREKCLPDPELKRRCPNCYEELSSIFVEILNVYGTRTHSVLLVDGANRVKFVEKTLMPDRTWKYQTFNVTLEGE